MRETAQNSEDRQVTKELAKCLRVKFVPLHNPVQVSLFYLRALFPRYTLYRAYCSVPL